MSLKAFHVFFISVSVLLCLGFGVWCFASPDAQGKPGYHALGIASFVIAAGLVAYEIRFVRKFKDQE